MKALPTSALLNLAELDAPPTPPRYVVSGLVERGSVVLLAGDSGAAKSILAQDLAVAVVQGRPWLGRAVERSRVVYVDGEMQKRTVVDRLRALGARSEDVGLRYWHRPPLALGLDNAPDVGELREDLRAHEPAVLILDTALALCAVDPNSNAEVARLYSTVLRRLAEDLNLSVIVLHHESKGYQHEGGERSTASAGRAALGAMSWRGQADVHIAVEVPQRPYEADPAADDGSRRERYRVLLKLPKQRDSGDREHVERVCVESERTAEGALLWMKVTGEGRSTRDDPAAALRQEIVAVVEARGECGTSEIADAVKADPESGHYKRQLSACVRDGLIARVGRGRYVAKGRA